jgi:hypothetical protein
MAYLDIDNLYKNGDILMFKECYALEKIHGTSAHISFKRKRQMVVGNYDIVDGIPTPRIISEEDWQKTWPDDIEIDFFSGGEKHTNFVGLFDASKLEEVFRMMCVEDMVIYGEAYGGKCRGMSDTYGKSLKFIVFDVKIVGWWLDVPNAEDVAKNFGLEFVWYTKTSTELDALNILRDRESEQAIRNGCGSGKKAEGVVLRPLIELRKNNGERIIVKHKRDDFRETRTPRVVGEELRVLTEANKIADEWVTEMRLDHILGKMKDPSLDKMGEIIKAMVEDVVREGDKEIVDTKDVRKAIGRKAAEMAKRRFTWMHAK